MLFRSLPVDPTGDFCDLGGVPKTPRAGRLGQVPAVDLSVGGLGGTPVAETVTLELTNYPCLSQSLSIVKHHCFFLVALGGPTPLHWLVVGQNSGSVGPVGWWRRLYAAQKGR